ncbi:MAG: hypothetical protein WC941_09685 [Candidatus Bathyarchaeia archaeon]
MARATYRKIDAKGRICLPSSWRNKLKTKKVLIVEKDEILEIIPIEPIPPTALFDSIIVEDDVNFTDPHDLERAALKKQWGN